MSKIRKKGTPKEGIVAVRCEVWARNKVFNEPALCWALNTLHLLSLTFQTGALHPNSSALFLEIP